MTRRLSAVVLAVLAVTQAFGGAPSRPRRPHLAVTPVSWDTALVHRRWVRPHHTETATRHHRQRRTTRHTAPPAAPPTPEGGVWDRLAWCESRDQWHINTDNGFSGGLQFTESTWASFGGHRYAAHAYLATRDEQITVARHVQAVQGWGAWPVCSVKMGIA